MEATHWVVLRSVHVMRQAANWADEDPVYDEFGNAYNDVAEGAAKTKPGAASLPGLSFIRRVAAQRKGATASAAVCVASAGHRPNPPPCSICRQPM